MLNIVHPDSSITQESAPFTLLGNRGCLHKDLDLVYRPRTKGWIYCTTSAMNDPREFMKAGENTELFFLDEATALAAGHRPCGTCNFERSQLFYKMWAKAFHVQDVDAKLVDRQLRSERDSEGRIVPHEREISTLPDGVFILSNTGLEPLLLYTPRLDRFEPCAYPWTSHGYGLKRSRPKGRVQVLTPPSIVEVIRAGFSPGPEHPLLAW